MNRSLAWKHIKQLYHQYTASRSSPDLWKGEVQVGITALCNALFNVVPSSTTFGRRVLKDWERKKTLQYSIPSIEKKAISLFEERQPQSRRYNLSKIDQITSDDVYHEDRRTITKYGKPKFVDFASIRVDLFGAAVGMTRTALFAGEQPLCTFEEALQILPKDTSSCYPLYEKKSSELAIRDSYTKLMTLLKKESLLEMVDFLNTQLVTVFHRFTTKLKRREKSRISGSEIQEAAKDRVVRKTKIRQVFGVPFLIAILEVMMFGKALKQICRPNPNGYFSYSLTRPEVSLQVRQLKVKALQQGRYIYCGDFSKMDSSIAPIMQYLVVEFLISHVRLEGKMKDVYLAYLIWILFTPVAWASRSISWTVGGNISGSYTTSFTNSYIVLVILKYFYLVKYGRTLETSDVKILGDDFILLLDNPNDVYDLKDVISKFSMKINTQKSSVKYGDEDIEYLGFHWDLNGEPYNDDLWYLARICFPERFVHIKGYERIIQRAASILFQLRDGGKIFDQVFVGGISWFRKIINQGYDPEIDYIDKSGSYFSAKIPYSTLRHKGWRAF